MHYWPQLLASLYQHMWPSNFGVSSCSDTRPALWLALANRMWQSEALLVLSLELKSLCVFLLYFLELCQVPIWTYCRRRDPTEQSPIVQAWPPQVSQQPGDPRPCENLAKISRTTSPRHSWAPDAWVSPAYTRSTVQLTLRLKRVQ